MTRRIISTILLFVLCATILRIPGWVKQPVAVQAAEPESFDCGLELQVLHGEQLLSMTLSQYLGGVVSAELPAEFPLQAQMAQAVAARTFTLRQACRGKHEEADVCTDSSCCQAWNPETNTVAALAVQQTDGLTVVYQDELIEATYFSCSGGMTESAAAVWGSDLPYLQSVPSPGEEAAPRFEETLELTPALFASRLLTLQPEAKLEGEPHQWFGKILYTSGGGIAAVQIGGESFDGTALRRLFGLRSTDIRFAVSADCIRITTRGYGHRVGMSQYGARAMAEAGCSFEQILSHYYQNTEIKRLFHTEEASYLYMIKQQCTAGRRRESAEQKQLRSTW